MLGQGGWGRSTLKKAWEEKKTKETGNNVGNRVLQKITGGQVRMTLKIQVPKRKEKAFRKQ